MIDMFLKIFKPLIKLVIKIHSPWSKKRTDIFDLIEIKKEMKAGDIFLTKTYGELSNIINPAKYKHAAMCIDRERVIEATTKGVKVSYFTEFVLRKDEVLHLRPNFLSKTLRISISKLAIGFKGREYDLEFNHRNDKYYCFELIVAIYKKVLCDIKFKHSRILLKKFYSDKTFLNDSRFILLNDSEKI